MIDWICMGSRLSCARLGAAALLFAGASLPVACGAVLGIDPGIPKQDASSDVTALPDVTASPDEMTPDEGGSDASMATGDADAGGRVDAMPRPDACTPDPN